MVLVRRLHCIQETLAAAVVSLYGGCSVSVTTWPMAHWEALCTELFKTATLIKADWPSDLETSLLHAWCALHLQGGRKAFQKNAHRVKYEPFCLWKSIIHTKSKMSHNINDSGSLYLLRSLEVHKVTGTFILPERLFAHPICDTEQHFKSFFVNKVKCPHRSYCENVFKPPSLSVQPSQSG